MKRNKSQIFVIKTSPKSISEDYKRLMHITEYQNYYSKQKNCIKAKKLCEEAIPLWKQIRLSVRIQMDQSFWIVKYRCSDRIHANRTVCLHAQRFCEHISELRSIDRPLAGTGLR